MDQKVFIKKMIKDINGGDYSSAKQTLKTIIENKIQDRIKDALQDEE
jgi:hypothetical protein